MNRLAQRYASALFKLSQEYNVIDAVRQDLSHVINTIQNDEVIQKFFVNPLTSFNNMHQICVKFGELLKLSPLTMQLLTILCRHKRMSLLKHLIAQFDKLNDSIQQKTQGEVITAVPLTQTTQKQLQKIYHAASGQTIEFTTHVDSSLIGGMIVKIGSLMIDTSLKTRLNKIKSILKQ